MGAERFYLSLAMASAKGPRLRVRYVAARYIHCRLQLAAFVLSKIQNGAHWDDYGVASIVPLF